MLSFKGLRRMIACLLALCALVAALPAPARAVTGDAQSAAQTSGHTVSYVRYSANPYGTIIGCLENGTKLKVLDKVNNYYRIDCFDLIGYIATEQVRQDENGDFFVSCAASSPETTSLPAYSATDALKLKGQIRDLAMQQIGVPYVSGGTTPYGFDCSGFTQYVFNNSGHAMNRSLYIQMQDSIIIAKEDLQCGDLIIFQNTTGWGHFASHIGIYIGNGQLIHAGSRGIAVVGLDEAYYTYHYMCARRVILTDIAQETMIPAIGINQNINSSYWRESSQTETESGSLFWGFACIF